MRSLTKGPAPKTIDQKRESLTAEYLAAPSKNKPTPWKASDILLSLKEETHSKCAYCESKVGAVAWEHIEHYRPKKYWPELVVAWDNLSLACPKCNISKGDHNPEDEPLVSPYEKGLERRFVFAGGSILPRPGDIEARDTIRLLKLYRSELEERRRSAIKSLESLLHDWARASDSMKSSITDMIVDAVEDDQEYTSFLRGYLRMVDFPVDRLLGERRKVSVM